MKKLLVTLAALSGFFIAQNIFATCSNYTTYASGQTLTSSSLNSLQSNYTNCINEILNGDTFTGNMLWYSGSNIAMYSDTGSTLKFSVDGTSGNLTTEGQINLGTGGVVLNDDGDGALTITGAGNGSDEDLTLNLDDTSNHAVVSSSTGVTDFDLTGIDLLVGGSDLSLGSAGVMLTGDGDGAITFLGLGDGSDEDLTLNLDDTSNTGVFTSSTGLNVANFSSISLQESGNNVPNATDNLSFFAATTSSQLAGVLSDETGSGAAVFGTSPALGTPVLTSPSVATAANFNSGADLNIYSDGGSTLKASIDGATGKIIGAPYKVGTYNIDLQRATTSATGDSILIQCGGATCSATNPGFVVMNSASTAGNLSQFTITSNVTIDLTGAHWGAGTLGDITGRVLRVLAVNDNGSLRWCVALEGGRDVLATSATSATQTAINLPEEALCNTAVGSSSNTVLEIGYFRSNFDDTGGSSEDLNTIQSGIDDVVTGKIADGIWQPYNPTLVGWSGSPTKIFTFTQIGQTVHVEYTVSGTSNSTNISFTQPFAAAANVGGNQLGLGTDNGSRLLDPIKVEVPSPGDRTSNVRLSHGADSWTNSGQKIIEGVFVYHID